MSSFPLADLAARDATRREPAADEAELISCAQRDRRAFAPLHKRYADPIYRYCYRRLGSHDAAADATGQTFAKALAALPRYRHRETSFRSWLFAIAHNVVTDAYRRRRPDASLAAAALVADAAPSPEEQALAAEDRRSLRALLDRLPVDQGRVVDLRLAGLTGPEIARVLGKTALSVKSLQFRAYARLRRALESDAGPIRSGDR